MTIEETIAQLAPYLSHKTLEYLPSYAKVEELMKEYDPDLCQFFTIILKEFPIDRHKFEETPFVYTEYNTFLPPVKKEAMELMEREHGQDYKKVEEIINRYYPKDKTEFSKWFKEFDYYIEALLSSYYPEALETLLYDWALIMYEFDNNDSEDFEDEQYQKILEENKEEADKYKKSLFFPVYEKSYHMNYEAILPPPLAVLNHCCSVKQFYFIKKNETLSVIRGCGCGSGTRFSHGLYGHFFTMLSNKQIPVTTFITEINEHCLFNIQRKEDHLILYRHNLIGNYQVDGQRQEEVFEGIEMYTAGRIS